MAIVIVVAGVVIVVVVVMSLKIIRAVCDGRRDVICEKRETGHNEMGSEKREHSRCYLGLCVFGVVIYKISLKTSRIIFRTGYHMF